MTTIKGNAGFVVTEEMRRILRSTTGFIKSGQGGTRLRGLYQDQSMSFDPYLYHEFAFWCFTGDLDKIKRAVENGNAPDLEGTETPFEFGYATIVVTGAQRISIVSGRGGPNHLETLKYLLDCGTPPDRPDVCGHTALQHIAIGQVSVHALLRLLIAKGANPNAQNRYGEVALHQAFQTNQWETVDIIMEHGADLDVKDADDFPPRKMYMNAGPRCVAIVQKWIRERSGGDAPAREEKVCDSCRKASEVANLKICGKCKSRRYCTVECQKKDWPTHKKACQPFSSGNTVTVKPVLREQEGGFNNLFSTSDSTRVAMGIPTPTPPKTHTRASHLPKNLSSGKPIIIKVQVPYAPPGSYPENAPPQGLKGDLLVYTKKRDFACVVQRNNDPAAYDRLSSVVRDKGVGGAKAYFAAELKSKDELVVKVSEVLAAQPF